MIEATRDDDATVRIVVLHALGKFGAAARKAIPDIKTALQDQEVNVRQEAEKTLQKIELPGPF